jgi:hypothetical protein
MRRASAEPVVDALVGKLTHMVFRLQCRCEGAVCEHGMDARVKIDVTFP